MREQTILDLYSNDYGGNGRACAASIKHLAFMDTCSKRIYKFQKFGNRDAVTSGFTGDNIYLKL